MPSMGLLLHSAAVSCRARPSSRSLPCSSLGPRTSRTAVSTRLAAARSGTQADDAQSRSRVNCDAPTRDARRRQSEFVKFRQLRKRASENSPRACSCLLLCARYVSEEGHLKSVQKNQKKRRQEAERTSKLKALVMPHRAVGAQTRAPGSITSIPGHSARVSRRLLLDRAISSRPRCQAAATHAPDAQMAV